MTEQMIIIIYLFNGIEIIIISTHPIVRDLFVKDYQSGKLFGLFNSQH